MVPLKQQASSLTYLIACITDNRCKKWARPMPDVDEDVRPSQCVRTASRTVDWVAGGESCCPARRALHQDTQAVSQWRSE